MKHLTPKNKRQGKTLDNWVSGKSKEWLRAYMVAIKEGGSFANGKSGWPPSTKLIFETGNTRPSAATKTRLEDIALELGFPIEFPDPFQLLPPPNF